MKAIINEFKELKGKYPNYLLLFRCGNFYEAYGKDAVNAALTLNLVSSPISTGDDISTIECASFPHDLLDTYLPKLIRADFKVAIRDSLLH